MSYGAGTSRAYRCVLLALLGAIGVVFSSNFARAEYVLSDYGGTVWRKTYTLAVNETLQLQTVGCSGNEDTAMFLLEGTGPTRKTRAWNDDQGTGFTEPFCSYIVFTNTSTATKTYQAVATVYPGGPGATVDITSWRSSTGWITESSGVTLRGVVGKLWASGSVTHETVGRRQTDSGGYSDTVLYLIDTNLGAISAYDDDSGLGPLSRITASLPCSGTTYNCWLVAGHYSQTATNYKFEAWGRAGPDADGDGVQDAIEAVKGTRADLSDTDGDGLSDYEEFFGVPAASLVGTDTSVIMPWEDTGASPTNQDLFVEIDYMIASDHDHNPALNSNWPNHLADLTQIFAFDPSFSGRTIWPHVQVSNSMPETAYVTFGSCGGSDTTNFYARKSSAAYFNPLRASVFHYSIWGHSHKHTNCSVSNWIGQAEIWGNDIISALGGQTNQVGSTTVQRVNFIHELGHNLSLSHNGNGSSSANSCVHASVMNYRYSNFGWGSQLRGSGYSNGTCSAVAGCANTCAANRCVPSTQTSPKAGCSRNNGSCDCDRAEWALVNLDVPSSGLMSFSGCQVSNCSNGDEVARAEMRSFFLEGAEASPLLEWVAERRQELLLERGFQENVDFLVHPENQRAYSLE
jgi:hypothetical protein